jgi:hypothetical protein
VKNEPIAISSRAAADLRQLLDQAQRINDRLNIYVEAIGAALDVAPGWRFDVNAMVFMPPTGEQTGEPADPPTGEGEA